MPCPCENNCGIQGGYFVSRDDNNEPAVYHVAVSWLCCNPYTDAELVTGGFENVRAAERWADAKNAVYR